MAYDGNEVNRCVHAFAIVYLAGGNGVDVAFNLRQF